MMYRKFSHWFNVRFEDSHTEELIQKIIDGRQVDCILGEKISDEVGYMTWDEEHWVTLDGRKYVCTYTLEGRQLNDYTSHNSDDLYNEFHPEKAVKVTLS